MFHAICLLGFDVSCNLFPKVMLPMSTHNVCFCGEIGKKILLWIPLSDLELLFEQWFYGPFIP